MHESDAVSPNPINNETTWYMHPFQEDNLMVLYGKRHVQIYKKGYGVLNFTVEPKKIYKNGELILDGSGMLVWSTEVFHRIVSGSEGSASVNLATHLKGFDIKTNFNIYELNTETGEYRLLREGYRDQLK